MNAKAKYYIDKLKLIPHPEGGYYKEIYRSGEFISIEGLPKRYKSKRVFSTSIYFLLEGKQISRFHRLKSDEVWHFYDGNPVVLYILNNNIEKIILGKNIVDGNTFQYTIRKNNWFAAEVIKKDSFALLGCSVSPGFDFNDFELAEKKYLQKKYPDYEEVINRFT